MAEDRDPNRHPGDANDEESDDFIIIQVEDCPPSNPRNTSNTSSNTSSVKTNDLSSVDSGFDFEDYVEVSYDDVQTEVYIYNRMRTCTHTCMFSV